MDKSSPKIKHGFSANTSSAPSFARHLCAQCLTDPRPLHVCFDLSGQLNVTRDISVVTYGGSGEGGAGGMPAYIIPEEDDDNAQPLFVLDTATGAALSLDNVVIYGFQAGAFSLSAHATLVILMTLG